MNYKEHKNYIYNSTQKECLKENERGQVIWKAHKNTCLERDATQQI